MTGPEDHERAAEQGAGLPTERTVEEAADLAAEEIDVERPVGSARPERTGPDGEPLGGEGS